MTGLEHYREAERLIRQAVNAVGEVTATPEAIAVAQVHATLAVADVGRAYTRSF